MYTKIKPLVGNQICLDLRLYFHCEPASPPAGIYLFKVNSETLEQYVKSLQSYQ